MLQSLNAFGFTRSFTGGLAGLILLSLPFAASSEPLPVRAIMLNALYGDIPRHQPQPVQLKVIEGQAKGCLIKGTAYLNKPRRRYEYTLTPPHCRSAGQNVPIGLVVRGQHNIIGTMANSGMGRPTSFSNKGLIVTLSE